MDYYLASVDPETGAIELMGNGEYCTARFIFRAVGKHNRWSRNMCGKPAVGSVA